MRWPPNSKTRQPTGFALQAFARELHTPLVAALLALQGALALLLAARAIGSPATQNTAASWGATGMLAWAVVAASLAALARWVWFTGEINASPAFDSAARYLPLAAVSLTAAAIPLAGAGLTATALVWLLLATEELVAMAALPGKRLADRLSRFRRARPDAWRRDAKAPNAAPRPTTHEAAARPTVHLAGRSNGTPASPPADAACAQRLIRVQNVDGADLLEGSFSTRFAPGQTTAQIHVSFCPSFARVPLLDFRQLAGPLARVKLGQLLPHGARLDIKLAEPTAAAGHVTLEIIARHTPQPVTTPFPAPGASAGRSFS